MVVVRSFGGDVVASLSITNERMPVIGVITRYSVTLEACDVQRPIQVDFLNCNTQLLFTPPS